MSISYDLTICTDEMAEPPNAEYTKYAEPQPENTMETDEPEPTTTPVPQPSMAPNVPLSEQTAIYRLWGSVYFVLLLLAFVALIFLFRMQRLQNVATTGWQIRKKEAVWQKPPSNAPC